jgi:lipoprotein-anchoring transpeptidase ErfK/SrfK
MRAFVTALVATGVTLTVAATAWSHIAGQKVQAHRTEVLGERPPLSSAERIHLSKAQVRDAHAIGALRRPVHSVLNISEPLRYGEFRWNEVDVPAGKTWVRVDLDLQLISVFRAGHEIGSSVILYGTDQYRTPHGTFRILWKKANHRSKTYDAAMPFTHNLTPDGVAIHGSDVRQGAGTHGCIGVPIGFAKLLFASTSPGDEVDIIGKTAASEKSKRA